MQTQQLPYISQNNNQREENYFSLHLDLILVRLLVMNSVGCRSDHAGLTWLPPTGLAVIGL